MVCILDGAMAAFGAFVLVAVVVITHTNIGAYTKVGETEVIILIERD